MRDIQYLDANIDILSKFVNWLLISVNEKVIIANFKNYRAKSTVNNIIVTVLNFYDNIYRHDDYKDKFTENLR